MFGQQTTEFNEALSLYLTKNYAHAEKKFKERASFSTEINERDPAWVMLMMSQYAQQNFVDAEVTFNRFQQKKVNDEWLGEAYYYAGKIYFQLSEYEKSLSFWLKSLDISNEPALRKRAGELAIGIIERFKTTEYLSLLERDDLGEKSLFLLSFKLAEFNEKEGQFGQAKDVLELFIKKHPSSTYAQKAQNRVQDLSVKLSSQIRIGVLLPFKSLYPEDQILAKEVFLGLDYAVEKFNKTSNIQISLVKGSTGHTVLETVLSAKEMMKDRSIVAIIGPLSNNETASILPLAREYKIPIISPTAMQSKLTEASEYVFQLRSSNYVLGKTIAEHAYSTLGKRRFAVMNSIAGKSAELAQGFIETIETLGGELVGQELYYEDPRSLKPQFERIHNKGIKQAFRDSLELISHDSLLAVFDEAFVERNEKFAEDANLNGVLLDSSKINVSSIDAIFLPISFYDSERIIPFTASSFGSFNFTTTLLGSDEWYSPKTFENKRSLSQSVNGMYVYTPFNEFEQSSRMNEFTLGFTKSKGKRPVTENTLGYRSIQFLLQGFLKENNTRENIYKSLRSKDTFYTIGGLINFDHKDRVNSGISILQLKNGRFIKVD